MADQAKVVTFSVKELEGMKSVYTLNTLPMELLKEGSLTILDDRASPWAIKEGKATGKPAVKDTILGEIGTTKIRISKRALLYMNALDTQAFSTAQQSNPDAAEEDYVLPLYQLLTNIAGDNAKVELPGSLVISDVKLRTHAETTIVKFPNSFYVLWNDAVKAGQLAAETAGEEFAILGLYNDYDLINSLSTSELRAPFNGMEEDEDLQEKRALKVITLSI